MRRKDVRRLVLMVVAIYAIAIVFGFMLMLIIPDSLDSYLSVMPFIVAIPAALLSSGFQRRKSYVKALQGIWPKVVKSGRLAIEYTFLTNSDEKFFRRVVLALSSSSCLARTFAAIYQSS